MSFLILSRSSHSVHLHRNIPVGPRNLYSQCVIHTHTDTDTHNRTGVIIQHWLQDRFVRGLKTIHAIFHLLPGGKPNLTVPSSPSWPSSYFSLGPILAFPSCSVTAAVLEQHRDKNQMRVYVNQLIIRVFKQKKGGEN